MGEIVSGLIGMGTPVKGEEDIARGAEAFGLAQAGQEDIESGAEAFGGAGLGLDGEDIDTGAEAFGITGLGLDGEDIDTGAEAFGALSLWGKMAEAMKKAKSPFMQPGFDPGVRPPPPWATPPPAAGVPPPPPLVKPWPLQLPPPKFSSKLLGEVVNAFAKGMSVEGMNRELATKGIVPPPKAGPITMPGQLTYAQLAVALKKKGLITTKAGRMVSPVGIIATLKAKVEAARVKKETAAAWKRARKDVSADAFYTYDELIWDFDLTSPASKPASDPVVIPLSQAAAKQVLAELATTGSVQSANNMLAKQGVAPPSPGMPAKTAGQVAYKAVARGLEVKGIVKTVAGKMATVVGKPPMPKSMKVDVEAEKAAVAMRLRERQRELIEARLPKVGITRFLPLWLRRGMTRAG